MQTYLVGGAVRDQMLGLPVLERDYVVVGATEDEMRSAGYRSIGRDFPVFLHPDTSEEYALARTEKKVAPGHQGFVCHSTPDVTLEQDLVRRDLTINAMAQNHDGELIDPLGGQQDLDAKLLRHVSAAFTEDPLRILRVARFKARFHHLGFTVEPGTLHLLNSMVIDGLLNELTPERIHAELNKALATHDPAEFFACLEEIGGNQVLWPEISSLGIERLRDSPSTDTETRFALLLLDQQPSNISGLCRRLKCSTSRLEVTLLVREQHARWADLDGQSAESIVDFFRQLDAIRKRARFTKFNTICEAVTGKDLASTWAALLERVAAVKARDLASDATGPQLGERVRAEQIRIAAAFLDER